MSTGKYINGDDINSLQADWIEVGLGLGYYDWQ